MTEHPDIPVHTVRIRLPLAISIVSGLGLAFDKLWPGASARMEGSYLAIEVPGEPNTAAIDDLPEMGSVPADDPEVHHFDGNGMLIVPDERSATVMAASFARFLSNHAEAINYLELRFKRVHEDQTTAPWVAVQVIRPDGLSPAELAAAHGRQIADLQRLLALAADHLPDDCEHRDEIAAAIAAEPTSTEVSATELANGILSRAPERAYVVPAEVMDELVTAVDDDGGTVPNYRAAVTGRAAALVRAWRSLSPQVGSSDR